MATKKENTEVTETKSANAAKTTNVRTLNVYQKLELARHMFLQRNVQKEGANLQVGYTYFELKDIIPPAISIFHELGLVLIQPNITPDNQVHGKLVNTDNPEETIWFEFPYTPVEPIVSNAGKQVTTQIQATGASITYIRRYMYMIVLDIVEADEVDSGTYNSTNTHVENASKFTTPEVRQQAKATLTQNENADELQITQLKTVLKKWKDVAEMCGNEEVANEILEEIAQIATNTQKFTVITKTECAEITARITALLGGYTNE